jgi:hypothetical protein
MRGLFSPNIRVSNEPLYLPSKIRTLTRCLSARLSSDSTNLFDPLNSDGAVAGDTR